MPLNAPAEIGTAPIKTLTYTLCDGIKCYSPDMANDYSDYPDSGFDVTEENAAKSFWVSSRNRLFSSLLKRCLDRSAGKRLLEIGCGTGDLLQKLVASGDYRATGSEIYLKGLTYCQARLPGVEFVQFDASEGIMDARFDVIAAFDVLEHIEQDRRTMANLYAMLEENGHLVLSVPQYMFLWSNLDEIVKHKRRYSRREMVEKLVSCGFEIERATSFVFALFPLMLLSRLVDKKKEQIVDEGRSLEKRVTFSRLPNMIFDCVMRIDELLIKMGLSLPFGGTLVVVARKPAAGPAPKAQQTAGK